MSHVAPSGLPSHEELLEPFTARVVGLVMNSLVSLGRPNRAFTGCDLAAGPWLSGGASSVLRGGAEGVKATGHC